MSDTEKTPTPAARPRSTEAPAQAGSAPTPAGRLQQGEATDGVTFTTRVARGVGEAPSDVVSEVDGLKETQEAVQKTVAEETEKGYRGTAADPTPNENYTVAGVTAGLPTPETTVYTPRSAK